MFLLSYEDVKVHRPPPLTAYLRRSHYWGWLALWLVILQFIAVSEHLSAVTAKEAGGQSSFLGLCTAEGFVPTDIGNPKTVNDACAFCAMDAMCGHVIPAPSVTLPLLYLNNIGEELRSPDLRHHCLSNLRYGAVRGPPDLSVGSNG